MDGSSSCCRYLFIFGFCFVILLYYPDSVSLYTWIRRALLWWLQYVSILGDYVHVSLGMVGPVYTIFCFLL